MKAGIHKNRKYHMTLSKILCKCKQDSAVNVFLIMPNYGKFCVSMLISHVNGQIKPKFWIKSILQEHTFLSTKGNLSENKKVA